MVCGGPNFSLPSAIPEHSRMSVTVCGAGRGSGCKFLPYILKHSFQVVFHKMTLPNEADW
jgi:hypothetical protein